MKPHEVIDHFGGVRNASVALDLSDRCINKWNVSGSIPYWSQLAIQSVTRNKLKANKEDAKKND